MNIIVVCSSSPRIRCGDLGRARDHVGDPAVAVAEDREDALRDRDPGRGLGAVREDHQEEVEHRRPVVERAGHALAGDQLEGRIGVLRHGGER